MRKLIGIVCMLLSFHVYAGTEKYVNRVKASDVTTPAAFTLSVQDAQYATMQTNALWQNLFFNKQVKNRFIMGIDHASMAYQPTNFTLDVNLEMTYQVWSGTGFTPVTVNKLLSINNNQSAQWKDKAVVEIDGGNLLSVKVSPNYATNPLPAGLSFNQLKVYFEAEIEVERFYKFDPNTPIAVSLITHDDAQLINSNGSGELEIRWPSVTGASEYDLEWVYVDDYDYTASGVAYLSPGTILLKENLFKINSTRISTVNTWYKLPYLYGHGYLLYRLRPVGYVAQNSYTVPLYGKWSTEVTSTINLSAYNGNKYVASSVSHEQHLNYQATMSYAEEGKSKAVVSYFDGSMRNRQSVTKVKTEENVVVGETYYDHQGRPAVTALPVPVPDTKITYKPNFNLSAGTGFPYDKKDFDIDVTACTPSAQRMKEASGSAQYYSPNAPFNEEKQKYVPYAEGYPFSVTEYTPDNTGKVKKQGGVGKPYQLGTGHETVYLYGHPEQEELDRLFGSEAGYAQHYQKQAVVDANGQVSVTYTDLAGKTVASNLIGAAPDGMSTLSTNQTSTMVVDVLNKANPDNPNDLGTQNNLNLTEGSLILNKQLIVAPAQTRDFQYELNLPKFVYECTRTRNNEDGTTTQVSDKVCYNCVADVSIHLKDECNTEFLVGLGTVNPTTDVTVGQQIIDQIKNNPTYNPDNCTSPTLSIKKGNVDNTGGTNWTTVGQLPTGNYSLSKVVKINEEAMQLYEKDFLDPAKNSCIIPFEEYKREEIKKLDFSGCNITCADCERLVQQHAADYTADELKRLTAECQKVCNKKNVLCEGALTAMLGDMSINGQYGQVFPGGASVGGVFSDIDINTVDPARFPLSVFNENNQLPYRDAIALAFGNNPNWRPNYRYPYNPLTGQLAYLDNDGNPAKVRIQNIGTSSNPVWSPAILSNSDAQMQNEYEGIVSPQYLADIKDFIKAWKPGWARSLVAYHPEYASYEYCIKLSASHDFDAVMSEATKLQDINAASFTNAGGGTVSGISNFMNATSLMSIDPLFNGTISLTDLGISASEFAAMKNNMMNALNNYAPKPGGNPAAYSAWEMAYVAVRAPYSLNGPPCAAFTYPSSYNNSGFATDEEWNIFKGFYQKLKQELRKRIEIKNSIANNSYNDCIGDDAFDKMKNDFFWTLRNGVNFLPWALYNNQLWPNIAWFSQYFNPQQPCSDATYALYQEKSPRFQFNSKLMGLSALEDESACYDPNTGERSLNCLEQNQAMYDELQNESGLAMYLKCGQCPNDVSLQLLIDALLKRKTNQSATKNDLINNNSVQLSCYPENNSKYPEYFASLEQAIFGSIGVNNHTTYTAQSYNNGTLLNAIIKREKDIKLQLGIKNNTSTIYTFEDIQELCCLKKVNTVSLTGITSQADHNFVMIATVKIKNGDTGFNPNYPKTKELVIEGFIEGYRPGNCSFKPICKVTKEAVQLQNLFNSLLYSNNTLSPAIAANFTSTTLVSLTTQPYASLLVSSLKDKLYAYVSSSSAPSTGNWSWVAVSNVGNNFTGRLSVSGVSTTCDISMQLPAGYNFNSVRRILNIAVDPNDNKKFTAKAMVPRLGGTSNQWDYVTLTGSSNLFEFGKCTTNQLPPDLGSGSSITTYSTIGDFCPVNAEFETTLLNTIGNIANTGLQPQYSFTGTTVNFTLPAGSGYQLSNVIQVVNCYVDQNHLLTDGSSYYFIAKVKLRNGTIAYMNGLSTSKTGTCIKNTNTSPVNTPCVGGIESELFADGNFDNANITIPPPNSQYYSGVYNMASYSYLNCKADHTAATTNEKAFVISISGGGPYTKQFTNLIANKDYKVSFWFSGNANTGATCVVNFKNSAGVIVGTSSTPVSVANCAEWKNVTATWNSGSNTSIVLEINVANPSAKVFVIDDVSFGKVCETNVDPCAGGGTELYPNGTFDNAVVDFTSQYGNVTSSGVSPQTGQFAVVNKTCTDHTAATSNNNYLEYAIDAYKKYYVTMWQNEFANLKPNTNYTFSAWFSFIDQTYFKSASYLNLRLGFDFINVTNGTVVNHYEFTPGVNAYEECKWEEFKQTWNSGTLDKIKISFYALNKDETNNGIRPTLKVDDISFKEPCSTACDDKTDFVKNGTFDAGNTAFTNDYAFNNAPIYVPGDYTTNTPTANCEGSDQTTASNNNYYLKCKVSPNKPLLWKQTIGGLNPGSNYKLVFYTQSLWLVPSAEADGSQSANNASIVKGAVSSGNASAALSSAPGPRTLKMKVKFGGNTYLVDVPTINESCNWKEVVLTVNSGTSSTTDLQIEMDAATYSQDNAGVSTLSDVNIDDISLNRICGNGSSGLQLISECHVPTIDVPVEYDPNPCATQLLQLAITNAQYFYDQQIQDMRNQFRKDYIEQCLRVKEKFLMKYIDMEHHVTLYYYDRAGNLVRTIPPQGVVKITNANDLMQIRRDRYNKTRTVFTNHTYATTYKYNSLNQLTHQVMPDHETLDKYDAATANNGIPASQTVNSIQMQNQTNGLAFTSDGTQGHIYTTSNGGQSWAEVNALGIGDIQDVAIDAANAGTAYAVGKNGLVLYTSNNGTNWNIKTAPVIADLFRVTVNAGNVYAYRNSGEVYVSSDQGTSWTTAVANLTAHTANTVINDISFDGANAIAVTDNGKVLVSYNLTNWIQKQNIASVDLAQVSVTPVTAEVYAVGKDATLLSKSGNSNKWNEIHNILTEPLEKIKFVDSNNGFAIGGTSKNVYQIQNSGANFVYVPAFNPANNQVNNLFIANDNTLFACAKGLLFSYNTSNSTWSARFGAVNGSPTNPIVSADVYTYPNTATPTQKDAVALVQVTNASGSVNTEMYVQALTNISSTGSSTTWKLLSKSGLTTTNEKITKLKVNNYDNTGSNKKVYGYALSDANKFYTFMADLSPATPTIAFANPAALASVNVADFEMSVSAGKPAKVISTSGALYTCVYTGAPAVITPEVNIVTTSVIASLAIDANDNLTAVGSKGGIWQLNTGNASWQNQTQTVFHNRYTACAVKGNDFYVTAEDGTLLYSKDNASSFETQLTGSNANYLSAEAQAGRKALVAGVDNASYSNVYSYFIDGTTPTVQHGNITQGNEVIDIAITSDNKAYMLSKNGKVNELALSTTLSAPVTMTTGTYGNTFAAIDANIISSTKKMFAVGTQGMVLHYNGSAWAQQGALIPPIINGASFSGSFGVAVGNSGLNGAIMCTTNGGSTWNNITLSSALANNRKLKAVYVFNPNKAIAVGENATILTTTDAGATWAQVSVSGTTANFNAVHFDPNQTIGVIAGNNVLARINPDFTGYTAINPASCNGQFNGVAVIKNDKAIAVGNNGVMQLINPLAGTATCLTYSGVQTWPYRIANTNLNINAISFKDYIVGYAACAGGLVMKTIDGGATWQNADGTLSPATNAGINSTSGNPSTNTNILALNVNVPDIFVGGNAGALGHIEDYKDEWSSRFYYDKVGRLVVSQNSQQFKEHKYTYSYTLFDALGRVREAGKTRASETIEKQYTASTGNTALQLDEIRFNNWMGNGVKREIVRTVYDQATATGISGFTQQNLRNRVSSVNTRFTDAADYDHATYYSYDIHGNVKTLIQDNPMVQLATGSAVNRYKRFDYEYDLISGKVNTASYQKGSPDQLIHKYEYDADNRITNVKTTTDGILWDNDARYEYYRHGPLSRVEIGDLKVQGTDYAYTLQGWIKGVNSNALNAANDIGKDGVATTTSNGLLHDKVAKDEFGYSITYFNDAQKGYYDYQSKASGLPNYFLASLNSSAAEASRKNLYNGNISAMVTSINKFRDPAISSTIVGGYAGYKVFTYDQLNRIKDAIFEGNFSESANAFVSNTTTGNFKESFAYDANGNIASLQRNDGTGFTFDNFNYHYQNANSGFRRNTNKLRAVKDAVATTGITDDVEAGQLTDVNGQTANDNYQYDNIGNLVKDQQEEIDSIEWTVSGKIAKITRKTGSTKANMEFKYDAMGNRIMKKVTSPNGDVKTEYYSRDAQGNVLAVYSYNKQSNVQKPFSLIEHDLYGSSRLGTKGYGADGMPIAQSQQTNSGLAGVMLETQSFVSKAVPPDWYVFAQDQTTSLMMTGGKMRLQTSVLNGNATHTLPDLKAGLNYKFSFSTNIVTAIAPKVILFDDQKKIIFSQDLVNGLNTFTFTPTATTGKVYLEIYESSSKIASPTTIDIADYKLSLLPAVKLIPIEMDNFDN